MTALIAGSRRGAAPFDVLRLHFSQRALLLSGPRGIMLVVFALTVIIAIIFWRAGSVPGAPSGCRTAGTTPRCSGRFPASGMVRCSGPSR